jgi:hypothetical protein
MLDGLTVVDPDGQDSGVPRPADPPPPGTVVVVVLEEVVVDRIDFDPCDDVDPHAPTATTRAMSAMAATARQRRAVALFDLFIDCLLHRPHGRGEATPEGAAGLSVTARAR